MISRKEFPSNFHWGVATSAYQIEGSPLSDGATPSVWHDFAHLPGKTFGGHHGDLACDHYRRMPEDVALMVEIGVTAYRFSIAWPRVIAADGSINEAGIGFYSRLVDHLLSRQIIPFVTLYHWDLPSYHQVRGGWLHADSPKWFAEYASVVFQRLGDRVGHWITLNEPWVVNHCGYLEGIHPPGETNPQRLPLVFHHLMLAHYAAVAAFRSATEGEIGIALNLTPHDPASQTEADVRAAARCNAYTNDLLLDATFRGVHSSSFELLFGPASEEWAAEWRTAFQPVDFLGVNYYLRVTVEADSATPVTGARAVRQPDKKYSEMGWEIYPSGLTEILCHVALEYDNPPIYITENGGAFPDQTIDSQGVIQDIDRWDYLIQHFAAAHQAMRQSVDLRGYFVWSLLDNFEWSFGYQKQFGIVDVDDIDQTRRVKQSGLNYRNWLRDVTEK